MYDADRHCVACSRINGPALLLTKVGVLELAKQLGNVSKACQFLSVNGL